MSARSPIGTRIQHLRQRRRSDGSWRVWWEPSATGRALGLEPVELDPDRPTWSVRQAMKLNDEFHARKRGEQPTRSGPGGRTIAALVASYTRDPEYLDKRPATRKSYDANLRLIVQKWGAQPVGSFSKAIMRQWYLTLRQSAGETQAVRLLGMFSILMNHAEMIEWRAEDSNPCRRLKMSIPKPRQRVASWAELDALVAAADAVGLASVGTACLMSALQGQRQTDVLASQRADMRKVDGAWSWQVDRSKRGTLGLMQLHPLWCSAWSAASWWTVASRRTTCCWMNAPGSPTASTCSAPASKKCVRPPPSRCRA
ncbi:hypothetical protein ACFSZS_03520 [Seohaeicola zhoushanensis]